MYGNPSASKFEREDGNPSTCAPSLAARASPRSDLRRQGGNVARGPRRLAAILNFQVASFTLISRAVFTSMEWRCHLSNCKRFASKPSYQNGRQSMQRTFWLSSKTPIHPEILAQVLSRSIFRRHVMRKSLQGILGSLAWATPFSFPGHRSTRATFLKYPSQCSLSPLASITQIFASFMSIYPIGCRQATFFAFDPGGVHPI